MSDTDLLSQLRIDPSQRQAGSRKRWPWLVIALILLLLLALAGIGWYMRWGRVVTVETVAAAPLSAVSAKMAVLDATGYIIARRKATVSSKVTGKLAEAPIEEGDRVTAGQVLARLDDSDAEAQLHLAQTQIAEAKAGIADLDAQLQKAQRAIES